MSKKTQISPRKSPKQSRSRGLVDTIVTAATRVLTKSGYEHATTNRVAEKAGVSIGSFYQYFPNKEALIGAVIDRTVELGTRKMEAELEKLRGKPMEEALRVIVASACTIYLDNRLLYRVLFEQAPRLDRVAHVFRARRHVGMLIEGLLESHGYRPAKPEFTMFIIMNAALGVIQTAVLDEPGDCTRDELVTEIVKVIKGYIDQLPRVKA